MTDNQIKELPLDSLGDVKIHKNNDDLENEGKLLDKSGNEYNAEIHAGQDVFKKNGDFAKKRGRHGGKISKDNKLVNNDDSVNINQVLLQFTHAVSTKINPNHKPIEQLDKLYIEAGQTFDSDKLNAIAEKSPLLITLIVPTIYIGLSVFQNIEAKTTVKGFFKKHYQKFKSNRVKQKEKQEKELKEKKEKEKPDTNKKDK